MVSKAIKVSESTYSFLKKQADERGESVKAVADELLAAGDIMDYAGAWEMSEGEVERIRVSRNEMWTRWEP
ncbi:MAG: hypothetical protein SVY41_01360 [Candidatus Nanohaloarchaea archaeon]|nr:hypothetical protein [Candidatus Nanohaloarchaea archaeon]